jgi:hypothetical protein
MHAYASTHRRAISRQVSQHTHIAVTAQCCTHHASVLLLSCRPMHSNTIQSKGMVVACTGHRQQQQNCSQ